VVGAEIRGLRVSALPTLGDLTRPIRLRMDKWAENAGTW
jgi:hypothetical protein